MGSLQTLLVLIIFPCIVTAALAPTALRVHHRLSNKHPVSPPLQAPQAAPWTLNGRNASFPMVGPDSWPHQRDAVAAALAELKPEEAAARAAMDASRSRRRALRAYCPAPEACMTAIRSPAARDCLRACLARRSRARAAFARGRRKSRGAKRSNRTASRATS